MGMFSFSSLSLSLNFSSFRHSFHLPTFFPKFFEYQIAVADDVEGKHSKTLVWISKKPIKHWVMKPKSPYMNSISTILLKYHAYNRMFRTLVPQQETKRWSWVFLWMTNVGPSPTKRPHTPTDHQRVVCGCLGRPESPTHYGMKHYIKTELGT